MWGPDQPDADPPLGPIPAATLTICLDRGTGPQKKCAGFPWYPWPQAGADDKVVPPGFVAYIEPGHYDLRGFVVHDAGECWYVGRGKTPADTVIHVNELALGKAAIDVQSPCHFVNLTIQNGELGYANKFGEGGVAGAYIETMQKPAAGKPSALVTFDNVIFEDNNNGLFSPPPQYDESQAWTQLVVRHGRFRRNSVFGTGGSHDVYVGTRWLSVIDSVFEMNIDSDDLKSRGAYAYVANTWMGAWAGRCIDRPNGGTTVSSGNTCVLAAEKPAPQRGQDAGQSGNHLYGFGEDQSENGAVKLGWTGAPDAWTDTGSTFWTGTPGARATGHCAQVMTVKGLTLAFHDARQIWGARDACIVASAPYGPNAPGTVTGLVYAPGDAPMTPAPAMPGPR